MEQTCPKCKFLTRVGAPYHYTVDGGLCISDWDAAIKDGFRSNRQAYKATHKPKYKKAMEREDKEKAERKQRRAERKRLGVYGSVYITGQAGSPSLGKRRP